MDDLDADGARIRRALNGTGPHVPAVDDLARLRAANTNLTVLCAEHEATIAMLRMGRDAAETALEDARAQLADALDRLAAAERAAASIPPTAPWTQTEVTSYLLGDDACGSCRHTLSACVCRGRAPLPAAAGDPAANGQPQHQRMASAVPDGGAPSRDERLARARELMRQHLDERAEQLRNAVVPTHPKPVGEVTSARATIESWHSAPPFDGDPDHVAPTAEAIVAAIQFVDLDPRPHHVSPDGEGGIEFYWRTQTHLSVQRFDPSGVITQRFIPASHERGPAIPSPTRPGAWILPKVL